MMSEFILDQIYEFFILFYAGLGFMLFLELYQSYKAVTKTNRKILCLQDILFWVFAGIFVSMFWYYGSYGEISIHTVAGFLTGILLWKILIYGKILNAVIGIYAIMKKTKGNGIRAHGTKEKKKKQKPGYRYRRSQKTKTAEAEK